MKKKLAPLEPSSFAEIAKLIQERRALAVRKVNTELIELYWEVGKIISKKLKSTEWGDKAVDELAKYLKQHEPSLRGFARRNLYRMRQFYEIYPEDGIVSALPTQLSWTHNLSIISQTKSAAERQFYLENAVKEQWSSRELDRQLRLGLFEQTSLNPPIVSPVLTQIHSTAGTAFKDSYTLEFLGLSTPHSEADLHQGLIQNMRRFLTELGRDFCFIGSEHPIQVGKQDFALDLLFFHRELNCLVAIELKVGRFEPEHLGKLNFYLEALDRDIKKKHENPSIGLLLCASKDDEVVEYALSRSLSPSLIAQYETKLPDKALLQKKLHEFLILSQKEEDA